MNFGTRLRTVLAIATSLNTALAMTDVTEFGSPRLDLIYKIASVVINFIIVACVTYFNNDYTEIACEKTGEMRLKKQQKKGNFIGENFLDEAEEIIDNEEE